MTNAIELVPLNCVRCSTPIPAGLDEVAWACAECGAGNRLKPDDALVPLDLHYHARLKPGEPGRPYWVVEGRVRMDRKGYIQVFGKSHPRAVEFWAQPRNFFVPAFALSLDNITYAGTALTRQQPALESGPPAAFLPIVTRIEDVKHMIEFIVLEIEAERTDKVKHVDFTVELGKPELWVLP